MDTTTSLRLFRVIVPVDDIERAAHYYADLLQQAGMRISPGRHYFRCGGVTLAVYCPAADGDSTSPRANFEHLYFATPDLEGVYQRAQALGGLVNAVGDGGLPMGEIVKRPWGERSFYLRDPFGNPLCFVDASSVFTG